MAVDQRLAADAKLMLADASVRGIALSGKLVDTIVSLLDRGTTGALSAAEEVALLQAISKVAAKITPVTIDQLRRENDNRRWSRKLHWPSVSTILNIFCVLLILLIINLVTTFNNLNTVLSDIKTITDHDYLASIQELVDAKDKQKVQDTLKFKIL